MRALKHQVFGVCEIGAPSIPHTFSSCNLSNSKWFDFFSI